MESFLESRLSATIEWIKCKRQIYGTSSNRELLTSSGLRFCGSGASHSLDKFIYRPPRTLAQIHLWPQRAMFEKPFIIVSEYSPIENSVTSIGVGPSPCPEIVRKYSLTPHLAGARLPCGVTDSLRITCRLAGLFHDLSHHSSVIRIGC